MNSSSDPFSTTSFTITQVVTLKLSEKNYLLWKLQFEQFLSSQLLLGYVTGDAPCPSPTMMVRNGEQFSEISNPDFMKWVRTDQLIVAWIFGTLTEGALKIVYGLRSSQEVWLALAKRYNRVTATRKLDLQRKIQNTHKLQKSMSDYLAEIKGLCDQLDSIGSPISEHEKIYGVLNGLGKEYESISTVIENSMDAFPGICFEDVSFKLIGFDDKLQSYEQSSEISPHQAFYADKGGYRGGYSRGKGSSRGNYRGRGSYSTRGRGFHQQFSSAGPHGSQNSSGQRPTCQICGKYGHSAFKCYSRFDQEYQNPDFHTAFAAVKLTDQESSGHEWYPYSGASAHITHSASQLQNTQPYLGDDTVIVGNGDFLPITHIGSAVLPTSQGQKDKAAANQGKSP